MRLNVIQALRSLSDIDYQRRAWINHDYPEGIYYDDFTLVVHILFDDTQLADDLESEIGYTLRNKDEMIAIAAVIEAIDSILNKLGTDHKDEVYINHPDWNHVASTAKQALAIFTQE